MPLPVFTEKKQQKIRRVTVNSSPLYLLFREKMGRGKGVGDVFLPVFLRKNSAGKGSEVKMGIRLERD